MNEELKSKLLGLGFDEEQTGKLEEQGVVGDTEMAMLNEQEIRDMTGCTVIVAKKAVVAFKVAPEETAASNEAAYQDVLPALPDDESFIELLKVGGILKIDRTNVIAAIRAAIASDVGLFDLPELLIEKMESFAREQDEPVGEPFYRLQNQLARRRYSEILAALGTPGALISEKRKRETLNRLKELLWLALQNFNTQLKNWVETWNQGAANPFMMALLFTQQGAHGVLPPGILQPPDTAPLRDEGEAVINTINKVFAGTGIPVARALAYDAMKIRQALEDPSLPSQVGAATRDQMLKMLGIDVGADYVRLEQNVTKFALAIMELPKVTAGSDEIRYLSALQLLGGQIPWNKLGLGKATIKSSRRNSTHITGDDPEE